MQGFAAVRGWSFALIAAFALALSSCQGEDFRGPDGLIANHDGYWNGVDQDPQWAVESGVSTSPLQHRVDHVLGFPGLVERAKT